MYTALLISLSIPFPKLIKNLSTWMHNKCYGIWKAYLQSEQPTSLGWLLFSIQSMDVELLKEAISDMIENIPVSLCWKTISQGSQGLISKEQQVKPFMCWSMSLMSIRQNHSSWPSMLAKQLTTTNSCYIFGCAWFPEWMQS